MKTQAALATIIIAAAIGIMPANAAEKTARLTVPAAPEALAARVGVFREIALRMPDAEAEARNAGLSGVERDAIRSVVRNQINALAARDAERAYSHLSPLTKGFFQDASTFLATLNQQMIPMMYAKDFALIALEREATDAVQHVIFTGPNNREWLARFKVERQSDGAWQIKSCQVELALGQST